MFLHVGGWGGGDWTDGGGGIPVRGRDCICEWMSVRDCIVCVGRGGGGVLWV